MENKTAETMIDELFAADGYVTRGELEPVFAQISQDMTAMRDAINAQAHVLGAFQHMLSKMAPPQVIANALKEYQEAAKNMTVDPADAN